MATDQSQATSHTMNSPRIVAGYPMSSQATQKKSLNRPKAAVQGRNRNVGAQQAEKRAPRARPPRRRAPVGVQVNQQVVPGVPALGVLPVSSSRRGGQAIRTSDTLFQFSGTVAFTVGTSLAINAGLGQLFPWASAEARHYEKYRFTYLAFEYNKSLGFNSANADGNVLMAVDLDVLDANPATLVSMLQNKISAMFSPYDRLLLEVPQADLARRGWLYVRSGSVPSGADAKTYDVGRFLVATSGTTTAALGFITVHYAVEFDVQQPYVDLVSRFDSSAGLDADSLIGTVASVTTYTSNNMPITLTDADTFTFNQAGAYIFVATLGGATLVGTSLNVGARGTATISSDNLKVDAAATGATGFVTFQAVTAGQTFKPAITSAVSVSSIVWRVVPWSPSM